MLIIAKVALGFGGSFALAAGLLCSEGFVHVDVREKAPEAHHIVVFAPAMLAPIGVHLAPRDRMRKACEQLRPNLPLVRAAIASLREQDDMTIVEVTGPDQHVLVKKDGGDLVVDVDDPEEQVHVSVPLRAVSSTIEAIAASGAS